MFKHIIYVTFSVWLAVSASLASATVCKTCDGLYTSENSVSCSVEEETCSLDSTVNGKTKRNIGLLTMRDFQFWCCVS